MAGESSKELSHYRQGAYIDSKDTINNWCVARIVSISPEQTTMTVNYDGWADRWNATISLSSKRIGPFRRHSSLYTGQKKAALRDWHFSEDELSTTGQELEKLQSTLGTGDAYGTTQLLRGTVFTLVDNLLIHSYRAKSERLRVLEFFELVISYICKWLKEYPRLIGLYQLGVSNPDLFLTDDNVAVAMSWPELLFTLQRLFGFDLRTAKFANSDVVLKDSLEHPSITVKQHHNMNAAYLVSLFAKYSGLESVMQIVSYTEEGQRVPLKFLESLPVFSLGRYFTRSFGESWANEFKDKVVRRVNGVDTKELKDLDKDQAVNILNLLRLILGEFDRSVDCYELVESTELDINLKLLKCPYLEKRIKGVNEIRDMIERVKVKSPYVQGGYKATKWLTPGKLTEWLRDNQVVETILECAHVELTKRISDILVFLAKQGACETSYIDLLWNSAQGRHDSLIICTYQIIVGIAPHLKQTLQNFLIAKFREIPVDQYDERLIKLIKDFTAKALESSYVQRYEVDQFGVTRLYELMQDSSPVEFQELATDSLGELIKLPSCKEKLWEVAENCLSNIKQGQSVPQNLKLCKSILESLTIFRGSHSHRDEIYKKLNSLAEGVVPLVLTSIKEYLEQVRGVASSTENAYKSCLRGKYKHSKNLKFRLLFLEYLLSSKYFTISETQFQELWESFLLAPVTAEDQTLFFKWLKRAAELIFPAPLQQFIFEEFFCNPVRLAPQCVSYAGYRCFLNFFIAINHHKRKIDIKAQTFQSRVDTLLIGMDSLYEFLLRTEHPEIQSEVSDLIVKLTLRIHKSAYNNKRAIWDTFLQTCLELAERHLAADHTLARVLQLLLSFLNNNQIKEEPPSGRLLVIYAKTLTEHEHRHIQIYSNQTLGQLRRKVAELYNKPLDCIVLSLGNVRYDFFDDELAVSTVRSHIAIVSICPVKKEDLTPSEFLASNEEVELFLFKVLAQPELSAAGLAWTLLTRLPISEQISKEIESFSRPLEATLDPRSIYRLQYGLMIIKQLIVDEEWLAQFIQRGGSEAIKRTYLVTECAVASLTASYHSVMVILLEHLLSHTKEPITASLIEKLFQSLLEVGRSCGPEEEEPAQVVTDADKLLTAASESDPVLFFTTLTTFQPFPELLETSLLNSTNRDFSNSMMLLLVDLVFTSPELIEFALKAHLSVLQRAFSYKTQGENYWKLLAKLIANSASSHLLEEATRTLTAELQHREAEKCSTEQDFVVWGILHTLSEALPKTAESASKELVHLVLCKCLFETPSSQSAAFPPPICKHTGTRTAAFTLLLKLCKDSQAALSQVLSYLSALHEDPHWRTSRIADWNYHPTALEKSRTGFVWLKNLGCICYMISCLQQLYNIKSFREGVCAAEDCSGQKAEESVLVQLQKLFSGLAHSDKQHISPRGFCQAFKD